MTTPRTMRIWITYLSSNFEPMGQPFPLKMATDDTVGDMMIEAWKLDSTSMPNVNRFDLRMWKIKAPVRLQRPRYRTRSAVANAPTTTDTLENFLEKMTSSNIDDCAEILENVERIMDCFEENPEPSIQAFITLPDLSGKRRSSTNVPSTAEPDPDPGAGAIQAVATLSPPSDVLGTAGHNLRDKILIGRPEGRFGYPNAIFDPHLAKLHYDLESLHSPDNDSEALSTTEKKFLNVSHDFLCNALEDYKDERQRWGVCRDFFIDIFGKRVHEQMRIPSSGASKAVTVVPDAFWGIVQNGNRILPHVILEVKREKGCSQPTMQCIKYYGITCSHWLEADFFSSTIFPVILIGLNGHSLEISTALTLERITVNELLVLDLKNGYDRPATLRKLMRIASALAECASQLERKYQHLIQQDSPRNRHRRFFPQPTPDPRSPPSSPLPELTFLKRLDQDNNTFQIPNNPSAQRMRSLFVGTLLDGSHEVEVVVKFTATYNEVVHKLLAEKGLAPKLYACQRVIGNLFMVVMERIAGKPLAFDFREAPLKDTVFEDITRAVEVLKEHDLVHGDLRAVNVMVDPKQEHAKVIDFDWAGKSGTARYPLTINKAALSHEWHRGVEAGGLLETDHDAFAHSVLLKRK